MKFGWVNLSNIVFCLYRASMEGEITSDEFMKAKHILERDAKTYDDEEMVTHLKETSPVFINGEKRPSLKVSFRNDGRFSEIDIGSPLTESGSNGTYVTGRITDVKPEYVFAEIFARYAQEFIKLYRNCDEVTIETEEEER